MSDLVRRSVSAALLAFLAACAPFSRKPPPPAGAVARLRGLPPGVRFRPEDRYAGYAEAISLARARRIADGRGRSPLAVLALSGGGEDGAFGAGFLAGWTARGDRPLFDIITGVSTGALSAPFAFLGPAWDSRLASLYTEVGEEDIARPRGLLAALTADGMADTLPLYGLIQRQMDREMIEGIAEGHRRGRILHVMTVDLDAMAPVVWDIGAIAASGMEAAAPVMSRILLASAAIPGAFPPVMIDVEIDGQRFSEMHVDGGAVVQAFGVPRFATAVRRQADADRPEGTVHLLRNGRLRPRGEAVPRRTIDIAARGVSAMIAASGVQDVLRLAGRAREEGFGFRLASISDDFGEAADGPFDRRYMRALYAYGQAAGRAARWTPLPEGVIG